jgi:hypothetical protein
MSQEEHAFVETVQWGGKEKKVLDDFRKQNNAHHMILLTTAKSGDEC